MPAGRKSRQFMAEQKQMALNVAELPELKALLAEQVRGEVQKILGALKNDAGSVDPSDKRFAETLALAFAQLTEQGQGRKYVDPKILRERGEARDRMFVLIVDARKGYS